MSNPKGYWTDDYYVGILPDGSKGYFATEGDYKEYLEPDSEDPA